MESLRKFTYLMIACITFCVIGVQLFRYFTDQYKYVDRSVSLDINVSSSFTMNGGTFINGEYVIPFVFDNDGHCLCDSIRNGDRLLKIAGSDLISRIRTQDTVVFMPLPAEEGDDW